MYNCTYVLFSFFSLGIIFLNIYSNTVLWNLSTMSTDLKGVCHEIFDHYFPWFEPIWAPDKQGKGFRLFRYFIFMTPRCDAHSGVWLRSMMHTVESDSAVWCTLGSLTPQYDAHLGAWLRCMIHTAKFLKNWNILANSKQNLKILYPVYQGPRWVESWKKWMSKISRYTPFKEH